MSRRIAVLGLALLTLVSCRPICGDEASRPAAPGDPRSSRTVPDNDSATRSDFLQSKVSTFRFRVFYCGPWRSCRNQLTLYVAPENVATNWGERSGKDTLLRLTRDEALAIIGYLEKSGLLAEDLPEKTAVAANNGQQDAQYVLEVGTWSLKQGEENLYRNLGWGLPMLDRLENLRKAMSGKAGEAMERILAPLRSDRECWEKIAAKGRRRMAYWEIRWSSPVVGGDVKPGNWQSDDWKYATAWQAEKQRPFGSLSFRNRPIVAGDPGDHVTTPWGVMFHSADNGWVPTRAFFGLTPDDLKGRDLTPVGSAPVKTARPSSEKTMLSDLVDFLATTGNGAFRTAAIRDITVVGAGAEEVVPCLIEILKTAGDPTTCQVAASALGSMGSKATEAVPVLTMAIGNGADLREAVTALGNVGPAAKSAVPTLVTLLRDRQCTHRTEVARALGLIGAAAMEAVPSLREILNDEDRDLRNAATVALDAIQASPGVQSKTANPP